MKKVAIIGIVGIPAKYGGFETLVEYLTKYLNNKFSITVFCSSKSYTKYYNEYNGVNLKYISLNANGLQSVFYDIISLLKSVRIADSILILGVSGCIVLPFIKLFTRKKIIINIDGLEWKREKWKWYVKIFLKFSEKIAIKFADVIVSDNEAIQKYIFSKYKRYSELIYYGADHVKNIPISKQILYKYPFLKYEYALKVCRIEPENNIDIILETFSTFKKINIVVIGNWDNKYAKKIKKKYISFKNIYMIDSIYDNNILNQIRSNCKFYIHGHSAGGTNPSLIEAMYLGLPIIAYKVQYNMETTNHKAIYFNNKQELIRLLYNINNIDLISLSYDMKDIAMKKYIWQDIANKYSKLL